MRAPAVASQPFNSVRHSGSGCVGIASENTYGVMLIRVLTACQVQSMTTYPNKRLNLLTYLKRREKYGYTNLRGESTYILLSGRYHLIDWHMYE